MSFSISPSVAAQLLSQMPKLDLTWSVEVQNSWWKAHTEYSRILTETTKKHETLETNLSLPIR